MNRQPGDEAQSTGTPHTAPKQTIFQKGAIKTLETLPAGVSQEDLSRNDRRREKPSPGPNPGKGHDSSGDLQGKLWSWETVELVQHGEYSSIADTQLRDRA